jgi:TonB family protein
VISRSVKPEFLLLLATAAFAGELGAQSFGRSAAIALSDSLKVLVHIGSPDTSVGATDITVFSPQGIFRLRADSAALASWAKASASLPGPAPQTGRGSNGKLSFSATILRASNESGNAMRLIRLSGDSLSSYALAASNGAWECSGRVPPEKVGPLFHALAGSEGDGLIWKKDPPRSEAPIPGFREVEPAPNNPRPRYPPRAEMQLAAGEVVAQFKVDRTGRVPLESLLIVRSTHPLFSRSVRDALPQMRFLPATLWGVPVDMVVVQSFEFRLP